MNEWTAKTRRVVREQNYLDGIHAIYPASDKEALKFCNNELGAGPVKRPDILAKAGARYVIGEAKFLSSRGGNQDRGFDDGMALATKSAGSAYKIFVLDGVVWISPGTARFKSIDHSNATVLSALLLKDYLNSLLKPATQN